MLVFVLTFVSSLIIVPICVYRAFVGWMSMRSELGELRNGLALSALCIVSIGWVSMAIAIVPVYVNYFLLHRVGRIGATSEGVLTIVQAAELLALGLALAHKREPRLLTIIAILVLYIGLSPSVVI